MINRLFIVFEIKGKVIMKQCFIVICLIGLFANVALGASDYTISQGSPIALHEKPSSKSAITALLDPGMQINVTDPTANHGYVLASTQNHDKGWIRLVRLDANHTDPKPTSTPSLFQRVKSTFGFVEPKALTKTPKLPTGRRDQIINQYSQLEGAYLELQTQRQHMTFILGVITLLMGIIIGLWINKYRYNRNRW